MSSWKAEADAIAAALDTATSGARAMPAPRALTLEEAYAVQRLVALRRMARGERLVGVKIGLTRREKWAACGASDVILGLLTEGMVVPDGGVLSLGGVIAPGVEAELAFRMAVPLEDEVPFEAARDAIDAVAPALEIADSRIDAPGFVLTRIVADNSNAAGLVVGRWQDPPGDLGELDGELVVDGVVMTRGNTRTVSGHPLHSVCAAGRLLRKMGLRLEAGAILLSGGLTPARPVAAGEAVACRIAGLGEVSLRVAA